MKLNKALTVPVVGPPMATESGVEEIVMSWNVDAVRALRSVTVNVTL